MPNGAVNTEKSDHIFDKHSRQLFESKVKIKFRNIFLWNLELIFESDLPAFYRSLSVYDCKIGIFTTVITQVTVNLRPHIGEYASVKIGRKQPQNALNVELFVF